MSPYRKQYLAYLGLRRFDDWRELKRCYHTRTRPRKLPSDITPNGLRLLKRFGFQVSQAEWNGALRYQVPFPTGLSPDREKRFRDFVERNFFLKRDLGGVAGWIADQHKMPSRRART